MQDKFLSIVCNIFCKHLMLVLLERGQAGKKRADGVITEGLIQLTTQEYPHQIL